MSGDDVGVEMALLYITTENCKMRTRIDRVLASDSALRRAFTLTLMSGYGVGVKMAPEISARKMANSPL